jgi:hypothetical protein
MIVDVMRVIVVMLDVFVFVAVDPDAAGEAQGEERGEGNQKGFGFYSCQTHG